MVTIQILLYEGFDELDAIAPFEVFQTAAGLGVPLSATCVSLEPAPEVRGAHGLRVCPEGQVVFAPPPDLLLVPGGGWLSGDPRGVRTEIQGGAIPAALAQLHREGTTLACVCTGALLLAASGGLKGRPATTHHSAKEALRAAGASVIDARVVDDGDVISSGGVTSGVDLALWVLERWFQPDVALKVERLLEVERRGTVWRRGQG
jgi:transcriptional regulator GlxA family with amidase domain